MMGDQQPEISILDARLAEIDRRLSGIQTGLAEDVAAHAGPAQEPAQAQPSARPVALASAPRPPAHPGGADDADASRADDADASGADPGLVAAELRSLIAEHARLLDAMGELVASGERLIARAAETAAPRPVPVDAGPALPTAATAAGSGAVSVAAGPFGSIGAVRDFERALRTLPGVAGVELRGYEGGDRAVVDVHLSGPTS